MVSDGIHLPSGLERPFESDIGLAAAAELRSDGVWSMAVTTRRFAHFVVVEVPGFRPSDSWFSLAPGARRTLTLHPMTGSSASGHPTASGERPSGHVRALNGQTSSPLTVAS
jgi:beta-mannosidase